MTNVDSKTLAIAAIVIAILALGYGVISPGSQGPAGPSAPGEPGLTTPYPIAKTAITIAAIASVFASVPLIFVRSTKVIEQTI